MNCTEIAYDNLNIYFHLSKFYYLTTVLHSDCFMYRMKLGTVICSKAKNNPCNF